MDERDPRTRLADGSDDPRTSRGVSGRRPERSESGPGRDNQERQKPIRYGVFARFSDWHQAALDAKAGIPGELNGHTVATQTVAVLERIAQNTAAIERKAYESDRTSWLTELATMRAELPQARRAIEAAREQLEIVSQPLSEAQLGVRRPGDEDIDDCLVRERRQRAHRRRIESERANLAEAEARLDELQLRIAELTAKLEHRRRIAKAVIDRAHAYVRRRRAAYWRRLVRKHPDGERLNALLEPNWPAFPEWLDESDNFDDSDDVDDVTTRLAADPEDPNS